MAATNLNKLDGVYAMNKAPRLTGIGAIEVTDSLVTDIKNYPVGSEYFDITNFKLYKRVAVAAALADWQAVTPVVAAAGAPASTYLTDTAKYPVGTIYFDTTNHLVYFRFAASDPGVIGDYYVLVATTGIVQAT